MRILIAVAAFFLCLPRIAFAQDAKILADAKKEGRVVIYGSLESDVFDDIKNAFEKKTGITVDYWRA